MPRARSKIRKPFARRKNEFGPEVVVGEWVTSRHRPSGRYLIFKVTPEGLRVAVPTGDLEFKSLLGVQRAVANGTLAAAQRQKEG